MNIPESLTIEVRDLECVAFFGYQPAEPEVDAGESVMLFSLECMGGDVTDMLSNDEIGEIEDALLIDLHEYMRDWHEGKADHEYQLRKDSRHE